MSRHTGIDEETAWLKRQGEEGLAIGSANERGPKDMLLTIKADFHGVDEGLLKKESDAAQPMGKVVDIEEIITGSRAGEARKI